MQHPPGPDDATTGENRGFTASTRAGDGRHLCRSWRIAVKRRSTQVAPNAAHAVEGSQSTGRPQGPAETNLGVESSVGCSLREFGCRSRKAASFSLVGGASKGESAGAG